MGLTYLTPLKGYYPFIAYNTLLELGTAVESSSDEYLYSLGATDGKSHAVLLTYFNQDDGIEDKTLSLELLGLDVGKSYAVKIYAIDEEHDLECVKEITLSPCEREIILPLPAYTTYLVKIEK